MVWGKAHQEQYRRDRNPFETDSTDEEQKFVGSLIPPPFTATEDDIDEMMNILCGVLDGS